MLLSLIVTSPSLPETLFLMAFSSPPVNDRTEILQLLDIACFFHYFCLDRLTCSDIVLLHV